MLEKTKHAELLLEYGANPAMLNEAGQSALQLLPRDSVRSTKLYFKRMFEVMNFSYMEYFFAKHKFVILFVYLSYRLYLGCHPSLRSS